MTCVCGIAERGHVLLVGDSALTFDEDDLQFVQASPKVLKLRGRVIGFAGQPKMRRALRGLRLSDPLEDADEEIEDLAGRISTAWRGLGGDSDSGEIIGIHGRLFTLQEDWSWYEVAPTARKRRQPITFSAIGSGSAVALGALAALADSDLTPIQRAETALRIACYYDGKCRPPFTSVGITPPTVAVVTSKRVKTIH